MCQVHKRFTDEQIKVLLQGYDQGQLSRTASGGGRRTTSLTIGSTVIRRSSNCFVGGRAGVSTRAACPQSRPRKADLHRAAHLWWGAFPYAPSFRTVGYGKPTYIPRQRPNAGEKGTLYALLGTNCASMSSWCIVSTGIPIASPMAPPMM